MTNRTYTVAVLVDFEVEADSVELAHEVALEIIGPNLNDIAGGEYQVAGSIKADRQYVDSIDITFKTG